MLMANWSASRAQRTSKVRLCQQHNSYRPCSCRSMSTRRQQQSSTHAVSGNIVYVCICCVVCSCLNVICLFILKLFDEIQRRLVDDDDGVVELLLHLWRGERDAGIRMHRLFHSIVAGDAWSSAPADDACVQQFRAFFEENVDRSTRDLLS